MKPLTVKELRRRLKDMDQTAEVQLVVDKPLGDGVHELWQGKLVVVRWDVMRSEMQLVAKKQDYA